MIDYRLELNDEQYGVVMEAGGPLLVIAGAGSGKTRTLTYRVTRLIDEGADPGRILLATFTNKAARSMLGRVQTLLQQDVLHLCQSIARGDSVQLINVGCGIDTQLVHHPDVSEHRVDRRTLLSRSWRRSRCRRHRRGRH